MLCPRRYVGRGPNNQMMIVVVGDVLHTVSIVEKFLIKI